MALRTSGHLLLGIVRIYSRKAKYLLADCNEAFIKIKMAFRPGVVDLPEENREAAVATITLPEVFHDFDTAMPDINIDMEAPLTLNQSRAEDITLKEDYGSLTLMTDDGFGDMGFDDPEMARDATNIDEGFDHASLLLGEDKNKEKPDDTNNMSQNISNHSIPANKLNMSLDAPLKDDGFGGPVGEGLLVGDAGGLFESTGLFDDAPLGHVPLDSNADHVMQNDHHLLQDDKNKQNDSDDDDDVYGDMGPASFGAPSGPSSPDSVVGLDGRVPDLDVGNSGSSAMPPPPPPLEMPPPSHQEPPVADQTTLIQNEEETFALAPLDTTVIQGTEKTKTKRKRKLIVDEVKNISGEEMKSQLSDTSDIVTTLDLAPPTKRLMHWKETGGVEKLFALSGHPILSRALSKLYQRHLTTKAVDNEEFGVEEDKMELDAEAEQAREEELSGLARKRKRDAHPEEEIPRLEYSKQDMSLTHSLSKLPETTFNPIDIVSDQVSLPMQIPPLQEQEEPVDLFPPQVEQQQLHSLPLVEEPIMPPPPVPDLEPVQSNVIMKEQEQNPKQNVQQEIELNHKPTMIDDDEDYGAPASVGPPEEQLADETYEQFEERILNKRTAHMMHIIRNRLECDHEINFKEIVKSNRRKQVAQKFYTFLVLKKQQAIELHQEEPYGELIITRGPKLGIVY
ncbi:double-strand-break repair protein rad21 homolog [Centruroides sculpturatus]|uniref:double-strand-break repair protein rad21 homolog n=1 Tax=Centruroides sculpturatus TaxID=218467 RepID=UPI000C6E7202|nr:double-strand-break repair protein rad21 homolog [Centruroides sculpturatus]